MEDKNTQLFFYLVGIFEQSTLQYLGKLKNPLSEQIDRNMEQAQMSIDMLDMIKVKMNNNLNEYEEKYLDNVISLLKLNYVDEKNKDEKENKGIGDISEQDKNTNN